MSKEKLLLKSGGELQFAPTALQWLYLHTRSHDFPYISLFSALNVINIHCILIINIYNLFNINSY